ncbi:unnamed protein product [Pelagomonas calceolata]|uniref:Uncharacterized protein n=1 Tax=Pelagomonas calceolata TaxID=35677 RepID=A0A7S4EED2_9STRA|nr:unnamed protein product [Pelagomonas calceolata]|mmetsp:Transcript_11769/g.34768  ORF Transcript_11769/g.34768 Transcript_11769/m.34768 type:complete len:140 (+) Transcript_11769:145-564(+)
MADLETMYGEDAAQALYMWRFAGVSFGLEARFWWTLLGSLATASLTALGAIVYKVIDERISDNTWLTNELKDGLPYDGTTSVPGGTRAFGRWGGGKWIWMAYSIAGGAVIEYEIVSSAPDGEQLADDYEELGGGRCAVM